MNTDEPPASSNWPNFILEVVSSTSAIDWILYSQTSVVIDTDGIDRCTCESNHHAISAMIAPVFFRAGSSVFIVIIKSNIIQKKQFYHYTSDIQYFLT
jgi:hypothetical protein